MVFEKRVLRKTEESEYSYSCILSSLISIITDQILLGLLESKRIGWMTHMAQTGVKRNAYGAW